MAFAALAAVPVSWRWALNASTLFWIRRPMDHLSLMNWGFRGRSNSMSLLLATGLIGRPADDLRRFLRPGRQGRMRRRAAACVRRGGGARAPARGACAPARARAASGARGRRARAGGRRPTPAGRGPSLALGGRGGDGRAGLGTAVAMRLLGHPQLREHE